MATTITVKGQVTIPKRVRDALQLKPGSHVEFAVENGRIVIRKADCTEVSKPDRFDRARGAAQQNWRTKDLMKLLRD